MSTESLLGVLEQAADAIAAALTGVADWGLAGTTPGQHHSDVVADAAAVSVLTGHGLGVLSEETGHHHPERAVCVVLDPLDGSTNAHRRIPWYAASLCAVDDDGPAAAVVANLATGTRYRAVRGGGATRDSDPIAPSSRARLRESMVFLSGHAPRHLGWYQFRALGAVALDLCAVADGTADAYLDCSLDAHGPWDYLGALLVCREAGASVTEVNGRNLVVVEHAARRTPAGAANPALLDELIAAWRGAPQQPQ